MYFLVAECCYANVRHFRADGTAEEIVQMRALHVNRVKVEVKV